LELRKYIESGIIEDYVMGFVSDQEKQEVECLSKIYPEINEALRGAENMMTTWAADHAEEPTADLKEKIMANLGDQIPAAIYGIPFRPKPDPEAELENLKIETQAQNTKTPFAWIAAAAAVLLSAYMAYQWQESLKFQAAMHDEIAILDSKIEGIEEELEFTEEKGQLYQGMWATVSQPEMQKIGLASVKEDQVARATVYWNPEKELSYFYRNTLPPEGPNKQYQLWALVKGKPISMGLLSIDNTDTQLQGMTAIANADAFAITLEPLGGSETPTLEEMIVLGKV
jgi:anti-sigma-K factor RskA